VVRRIVTGHDKSGKAVVIADGPTPNVFKPPARPGVQIMNCWRVSESPAKLAGNAETVPADARVSLEPGEHGSVFRVIDFPPERDWIDKVDRAAAHASFAAFGAAHAADASAKPPHPLMHKTKTIDYAICLEGEMYLVLDDSEVLVKPGDVVVQRGTNHAWSNRSNKNCRMAFVLIDGTFG
jgi:mannose-6-phosphate isomerase-like protein (cupin superfamily)